MDFLYLMPCYRIYCKCRKSIYLFFPLFSFCLFFANPKKKVSRVSRSFHLDVIGTLLITKLSLRHVMETDAFIVFNLEWIVRGFFNLIKEN